MPDLTCWSGMSSIGHRVASAPVPDVVGTMTSGLSGDDGFVPPPIGGLT